jgi:hypothetical protein
LTASVGEIQHGASVVTLSNDQNKAVARVSFINTHSAKAFGAIHINLEDFKISEEPSQLLLKVPVKDSKEPVEMLASRMKDSNKFKITGKDLSITFLWGGSSGFQVIPTISSIPAALKDKLEWTKTRIEVTKCIMSIGLKNGTEVVRVQGKVDKQRTRKSTILGRDFVRAFNYHVFVTSDPQIRHPGTPTLVVEGTNNGQGLVDIVTYRTHVTDVSILDKSAKILNANSLTNLYVKNRKGEVVKLFDLYHNFRHELAKKEGALNQDGKYTGTAWDVQK